MNLALTLFSLLFTTIIMIIYYYSVFSQEKIKKYSNTGYALFIVHLLSVYLIVFTVLYLFFKLIINSKQIYPRRLGSIKYPKMPKFNGSIFNENFKKLFREKQIPIPIKYYNNAVQGQLRAVENPPYIFWD